MKYPTLFSCLLWVLLIACNRNHQDVLKTQRAAAYLLQNAPADSIIWQLTNIFDPYQGGTHTPIDSLHPQFLVIHDDGTFTRHQQEQIDSGNWYMRRDKEAIALVSDRSPEAAISSKTSFSFRYEIRKLSSDTMILAWQGRHGFVEELYVKKTNEQYRISQKPFLPE